MDRDFIPVASPGAAYHRLRAEMDEAIRRVLESGRFILGPEVEAFEAEFAAWLGAGHAVGVGSGTEAVWLALRAAGIGPGDEVIVPSLTASASVAAIVEAGARPAFADVHPERLTLDPDGLDRTITDRTRAILPVHLYGNPADMTAITPQASGRGLLVVEDCAQAHGARHAGRPAGTFGLAAAWSFYPTKNLGAFGDGGLVTTDDAALAARLRELREYGWRERYHSAEHGWNARLDELQAALLRVRLRHLDEDNTRRRAIALAYRRGLPAALRGPACAAGDESAEHLFVLRHPNRDLIRARLEALGIGTAVHYPVPCHLQAAYAGFGGRHGSLPATERAAAEVFSLPIYPELTEADVTRIIAAVSDSFRSIDGT